MKLLAVESLAIPEVKVLRFARFCDERGAFAETARPEQMAPYLVGDEPFVVRQINESVSCRGVARGLHFQWQPFQGKLVRSLSGSFLDVAVDIRRGSPRFGCAVVAELSHDAGAGESQWLWVPPGFAHGMIFDREEATAEYLCTSAWSPETEGGIHVQSAEIDYSLAEPELALRVRRFLEGSPTLSAKDAAASTLQEWQARPEASQFEYDPGAPYGCRAESIQE